MGVDMFRLKTEGVLELVDRTIEMPLKTERDSTLNMTLGRIRRRCGRSRRLLSALHHHRPARIAGRQRTAGNEETPDTRQICHPRQAHRSIPKTRRRNRCLYCTDVAVQRMSVWKIITMKC